MQRVVFRQRARARLTRARALWRKGWLEDFDPKTENRYGETRQRGEQQRENDAKIIFICLFIFKYIYMYFFVRGRQKQGPVGSYRIVLVHSPAMQKNDEKQPIAKTMKKKLGKSWGNGSAVYFFKVRHGTTQEVA